MDFMPWLVEKFKIAATEAIAKPLVGCFVEYRVPVEKRDAVLGKRKGILRQRVQRSSSGESVCDDGEGYGSKSEHRSADAPRRAGTNLTWRVERCGVRSERAGIGLRGPENAVAGSGEAREPAGSAGGALTEGEVAVAALRRR